MKTKLCAACALLLLSALCGCAQPVKPEPPSRVILPPPAETMAPLPEPGYFRKRLDAILQEREDPVALSRLLVPALLFGADHPYGHPPNGLAHGHPAGRDPALLLD